MSRLAISPSFSLLSLLPLSSLQDDPWLSPPPRLSSCPSSRVAVLHFFSNPPTTPCIPLHIGLQFFSYLRLIPGPWKVLFVNCTCQNCKMSIMQRKTKRSGRTVGWNLQVFLNFILRHHSHAQSLQQEITDLPLSSFAEAVTAEQIFFFVCVCQIKLVGLNELLQPTAATLGDRKSDKIAQNRGILLKASTSSCVICGQMCSQLIWNDMGSQYVVQEWDPVHVCP